MAPSDGGTALEALASELQKCASQLQGLSNFVKSLEQRTLDGPERTILDGVRRNLDRMEATLNEGLEKVSDDQKQTSEMEALREQVKKLTESHRRALEDAASASNQVKTGLERQLAAETDKSKDLTSKLKSKVDELKSSNDRAEDLDSHLSSLRTELDRLRTEHSAELQSLREGHKTEKEQLEAKHAKRVSELEEKQKGLRIEIENLKGLESKITELQESHEAAQEKMRGEHAKVLQTTQSDAGQEIGELRAFHLASLEKLREEHSKALKGKKRESDPEVNKLNTAIETALSIRPSRPANAQRSPTRSRGQTRPESLSIRASASPATAEAQRASEEQLSTMYESDLQQVNAQVLQLQEKCRQLEADNLRLKADLQNQSENFGAKAQDRSNAGVRRTLFAQASPISEPQARPDKAHAVRGRSPDARPPQGEERREVAEDLTGNTARHVADGAEQQGARVTSASQSVDDLEDDVDGTGPDTSGDQQIQPLPAQMNTRSKRKNASPPVQPGQKRKRQRVPDEIAHAHGQALLAKFCIAWNVTPDERSSIDATFKTFFGMGKDPAAIEAQIDKYCVGRLTTAPIYPPVCFQASMLGHNSGTGGSDHTQGTCKECKKTGGLCLWVKFHPDVATGYGDRNANGIMPTGEARKYQPDAQPRTIHVAGQDIRWILKKRKASPTDLDDPAWTLGTRLV